MSVRSSSLFTLTAWILFAITPVSAVTVDSASSGGLFNVGTPLTSLTWSHTVSAGANRAVFVGVSTSTLQGVPLPGTRITAITYGGVSMTPVGGVQSSPDLVNTVEMFMLLSPATGPSTVSVSFVPGVVNYSVGGSVSFFHVSQVTPHGTPVGASDNSNSITMVVADSSIGDIVLDTVSITPLGGQFAVEGAGQTARWQGRTFFSNAFEVGAGSTEDAVGSNTQMTWTLASVDNWAAQAVAIKSAPLTAASVSVSGRVRTPDGLGIPRARITLTDTNGNVLTSLSNGFGYYRFDDVPSGRSYSVNVHSKAHRFEPRMIDLGDDLTDLDLIAIGQQLKGFR